MESNEIIQHCYKTDGYLFSYSERSGTIRVNIFDATHFVERVDLSEALSHDEFVKWCNEYLSNVNKANNTPHDYVDAIIRVKVPKWQIGEEVKVYFPDTMYISGVCEEAPHIDHICCY